MVHQKGCLILFAAVIVLVPVALAAPQCPPCDTRSCPAFDRRSCLHGMATDRCRCCLGCARGLGQLCSASRKTLDGGHYHGQCGDGMECRKRDDLGVGYGDEWLCYCISKQEVCGTDGVTYDNPCQMRKAGRTIRTAHQGACRQAPVIISPPKNVKTAAGSWIMMTCETKGYPPPSVTWEYRHGATRRSLPGGDRHIAANSRGGPGKYGTTGFLQIMDLQAEHSGDYVCVARNRHGSTDASARLLITRDEEPILPTWPAHISDNSGALQSEYRPMVANSDHNPERQSKPTAKYTMHYVNSLPFEQFVELFGGVVDNCSVCAAATWSLRPFSDSTDLHDKMIRFVDSLPSYGQEGILRLFSGLKALSQPQFLWSENERQALQERDARYRSRFNFPLILDNSPQSGFQSLLDQADSRMRASPQEELKRSLATVRAIITSRICQMIDDKNNFKA